MRRSGGIIDTLRTHRDEQVVGLSYSFTHGYWIESVFRGLPEAGFCHLWRTLAAMSLLGIKLSIRSQLLLFCTEDDLVLLQINSNKVARIELSDCALDRSSIRDSLSSSEKQVSSFSSFAFGSVSNSLIVVASNESYVRYFMRPSGRCLR